MVNKQYKLGAKPIKYTFHPYALAPSVTATFEAREVKLAQFPDKDIVVFHGKSGWVAADRKTEHRLGRLKSGGGWYGFDTPEEAAENYLAKQSPAVSIQSSSITMPSVVSTNVTKPGVGPGEWKVVGRKWVWFPR
jgi:hypothetical protein